MLRSMTGFASATGSLPPHSWSWELRSVNGKGQDLRLRIPDWITGLEAALRKMLSARTARGTITMALRLSREEGGGVLKVNSAQVDAAVHALSEIEQRAIDAGLSLAPSRASDIAALRGVLDVVSTEDNVEPLRQALLDEADALISDFDEMRIKEGAAIENLLRAQLTDVADLTTEARTLADTRSGDVQETLRRNLAKVLDLTEGVDATRLAQELAMIAVKSDVTEEIDRLSAHVTAARDLLDEGGPIGRKLDFLMQEFNREANTLCAKAQSEGLTRCGLALKALIDQMREQVQNVE